MIGHQLIDDLKRDFGVTGSAAGEAIEGATP